MNYLKKDNEVAEKASLTNRLMKEADVFLFSQDSPAWEKGDGGGR